MIKLISLVLALISLSGCASHDMLEVAPKISAASFPIQPIPADKIRLKISRSSEMQYLAYSANVKVNGIEVAGLYRGDTFEGIYSPGDINISVATSAIWLSPGSYTLKINAEANTEYDVEIAVRPNSTSGYGTGVYVSTPFMVKLKNTYYHSAQK